MPRTAFSMASWRSAEMARWVNLAYLSRMSALVRLRSPVPRGWTTLAVWVLPSLRVARESSDRCKRRYAAKNCGMPVAYLTEDDGSPVTEISGPGLWALVTSQAMCTRSGVDPEQWYPVASPAPATRLEAAKEIAVCTACVVRLHCLEFVGAVLDRGPARCLGRDSSRRAHGTAPQARRSGRVVLRRRSSLRWPLRCRLRPERYFGRAMTRIPRRRPVWLRCTRLARPCALSGSGSQVGSDDSCGTRARWIR